MNKQIAFLDHRSHNSSAKTLSKINVHGEFFSPFESSAPASMFAPNGMALDISSLIMFLKCFRRLHFILLRFPQSLMTLEVIESFMFVFFIRSYQEQLKRNSIED